MNGLNKEQHAIEVLNNPDKGNLSIRGLVLRDILKEHCTLRKIDCEIIDSFECNIIEKHSPIDKMINEYFYCISNTTKAAKKTESNIETTHVIDFVFDLLSNHLNHYYALELSSLLLDAGLVIQDMHDKKSYYFK